MAKDTAILRVDPEGIGPAARLVSIFDPASVGEALAENGWSNSEAVEVLTEIARDRANATSRERMTAVKMLEDKVEKSLTLAGIIQRVSLEALKEEGGVKKKLTADGLRLLKEGTARTLSTLELLEAGSQTPDLIDVDLEESHDARTRTDVSTPTHVGPDSECPRPDGPGGGLGTGGNGCSNGGTGTHRSVHGLERPNQTDPLDPESGTRSGLQQNNQTTTGGAKDERSRRTPSQPGRSQQSSDPGAEGQQSGHEAGPNHSSYPATPNVGNGSTLDRPGYTDPGATILPNSRSTPQHRTTPYTPGEARRRATASRIPTRPEPNISGEEHPTVESPRPADGSTDAKSNTPSIAARYLPPGLAATGFPGDSTPDS